MIVDEMILQLGLPKITLLKNNPNLYKVCQVFKNRDFTNIAGDGTPSFTNLYGVHQTSF